MQSAVCAQTVAQCDVNIVNAKQFQVIHERNNNNNIHDYRVHDKWQCLIVRVAIVVVSCMVEIVNIAI